MKMKFQKRIKRLCREVASGVKEPWEQKINTALVVEIQKVVGDKTEAADAGNAGADAAGGGDPGAPASEVEKPEESKEKKNTKDKKDKDNKDSKTEKKEKDKKADKKEKKDKGSKKDKKELHQMLKRFAVDTTWKFTAVKLVDDTSAFIHTTCRIIIDLRKTTATAMLQSVSFPRTPCPTTTIADILKLKQTQRFDLMAIPDFIVGEFSFPRHRYSMRNKSKLKV